LTVRYAPEAEQDLAELLAYIVERSPTTAQRLLERIEALVAALDARRFDGPEAELTNGETVQSWPLYPYRVYYQRHGSMLYVMRVYHQARRPIVRKRRRARKR
jgi:plasmid stabilization system protein ParE